MELVALLSTGKGTWGQVSGLIDKGEWDNIFLVGEEYAQKFKTDKPSQFISVKLDQPMLALRDELVSKLKGKLKGTEVALSIASGSGSEHTALISALLNLPVGVKFAALDKEGILEL